MLNKVLLMGRLTRDPEIRYTQSGTAVANFSLAVDHDYTNKDTGERGVDFIDCVAWRGTAEFIQKYFSKGSMAVVVGRLQVRSWTDTDGAKRRSTDVNVDSIYFGESKRRTEGTEQPGRYDAPPLPPPPPEPDYNEIPPDDYDQLPPNW